MLNLTEAIGTPLPCTVSEVAISVLAITGSCAMQFHASRDGVTP